MWYEALNFAGADTYFIYVLCIFAMTFSRPSCEPCTEL